MTLVIMLVHVNIL